MTSSGVKGDRRRRNRPLRILVITLSIVCMFSLLSTLAASVICAVIFERSDADDPLSLSYTTLDDPPPRTRMSFASGSNTLVGYLYEAEKPTGIILIAHGMRGDNTSHLAETLYFVEHGWSVFAFDGTGTGESTGAGTVGLEQMVLDLEAAMAFLSEANETASLPLMLYGHSMGGYAATVAAAEGDCHGVVSIAGFESPRRLMLDSGRRYVGEAAVVGYPFLCLQNRLTFGSHADLSAVEAINASDASFLIVHGANDPIVTDEVSIYGNRDAIKSQAVSYVLIDDAPRDGHSAAWLSADAVTYRTELETDLAKLSEEYDGDIPTTELDAFKSHIDREALYELDESFMSTVLQFYTSALA